jgi:hypothetical protein
MGAGEKGHTKLEPGLNLVRVRVTNRRRRGRLDQRKLV